MESKIVQALGVKEDSKMTRVYLASPSSFFNASLNEEELVNELTLEESDR